jgi:hypothetical protein
MLSSWSQSVWQEQIGKAMHGKLFKCMEKGTTMELILVDLSLLPLHRQYVLRYKQNVFGYAVVHHLLLLDIITFCLCFGLPWPSSESQHQ